MNGDSPLVEDDKEIRQSEIFSCAARDNRVFQAENGLEGLKILEEGLTDLAPEMMMPVMTVSP